MSILLLAGIFVGSLFALSYISKRRFGVLGLGLCAGSLLSAAWAGALTPYVEGQVTSVVPTQPEAVVAMLLTLLPALVLLINGPTYSSKVQRIVGSMAFALLALVFLLQPIGIILVFDPVGLELYRTLTTYSGGIVAAGVVLAVADILMSRAPKKGKK